MTDNATYDNDELDRIIETWKIIEKNHNLPPIDKSPDHINFDNSISLKIADDDDLLEISADQILEFEEDFRGEIEFQENGISRTPRISEYLVRSTDSLLPYLNLPLEHDGLEIILGHFPLLTPFNERKMRTYNDFSESIIHDVCTIIYPKGATKLTIPEEKRILESFFFEIASKFNIGIEFSHLYNYEDNDLTEEMFDSFPTSLKEHNAAMKFFIDAHVQGSEDLRFLSFYKVLELIAPIYVRKEAFNRLATKLTSVDANFDDADYLNSIFNLSQSYQLSLKDRGLIKAIIDKTFILNDAYKYVPEYIKSKLNMEKLHSEIKKEKLDHIINTLSEVISDTRNSIVHAKSNYRKTGNECPLPDLPQLNEFMKYITHSTILWFNRQPANIKIDLNNEAFDGRIL